MLPFCNLLYIAIYVCMYVCILCIYLRICVHACVLCYIPCIYVFTFFNIPCCFHADCYPLFLLKCPQQPHRIGHYILCFNKNKLHVYSTHDGQRVWTWHLGHLRRFSYEPKVPFVEIEPGRSIPIV